MSTDRELLELAAKAFWGEKIGDVCSVRWLEEEQAIGFTHGANQDHNGLDRELVWNPRTDDGDSRRLQVDCGLTLARFPDAMVAMHSPSGRSWAERHDDHDGDSYAAARLAVLRAAAALGRDMP